MVFARLARWPGLDRRAAAVQLQAINRRRGEILNLSVDRGRCQLHAYVPLATLFNYTNDLRNSTGSVAGASTSWWPGRC